MAEAIGAVLAFAVGAGISPLPIIALILMLFSERATVNGPVFLLGWVLGLAAVFTLVYLVADALDVGTSDAADDGASWLAIALGALLLVAAARKWRGRPRPGDEQVVPSWMERIDRFGPGQALGTAVLLSANPKNLALALGAGTGVAEVGASPTEAVVAGTVFVLVASAVVVGAVAYDRAGGDAARRDLDRAKAWLTLHADAVMAVLLVVFAAVLISKGLGRGG